MTNSAIVLCGDLLLDFAAGHLLVVKNWWMVAMLWLWRHPLINNKLQFFGSGALGKKNREHSQSLLVMSAPMMIWKYCRILVYLHCWILEWCPIVMGKMQATWRIIFSFSSVWRWSSCACLLLNIDNTTTSFTTNR